MSFLKDYKPPNKKLNILVFGISNTGKSSTINNILSPETKLLRHAVSRTKIEIVGSGESLTQSFFGYKINEEVSIFDSWGWNAGNNYKDQQFEMMISGRLKNKQKQSETIASSFDEKTTTDFVLFVFDFTIQNSPTNTLSNYFQPFLETCEKYKIPYAFAVTKIDVFFLKQKEKKNIMIMSVEDAYDNVTNSEEWEELQEYIQKNTKRHDAVVEPLINEKAGKGIRDKRCFYFCKILTDRMIEVYENHLKNLTDSDDSSNIGGSVDIFRGEDPIQMKYGSGPAKSDTFQEQLFLCPVIIDLFSCHVKTIEQKVYRLFCFTTNSFLKTTSQRMNGSVCGMYDPSTFRCYRACSKDAGLVSRLREIIHSKKDALYYQFFGKSDSTSLEQNNNVFFLSARNNYISIGLYEQYFSMIEGLVENSIQERLSFKEYEQTFLLQKKKLEELENKVDSKVETEVKKIEKKFKNERDDMEKKFNDLKKQFDGALEYIKLKKIEESEAKEKERKRLVELKKNNPSKIMEPWQFQALKNTCGFNHEWKLLLRASEHGYKTSDFKNRCYQASGTLIIIKTDKNCVLGGWCPVKWSVCPNQQYYDAKGAWIFGFDGKKLIKLDYDGKGNYGIFYYEGNFFAFGGGHCIKVNNDCNQNNSSYTHLYSGNRGYPTKGYGNYFLNGGTRNFKVLDYEVYTK